MEGGEEFSPLPKSHPLRPVPPYPPPHTPTTVPHLKGVQVGADHVIDLPANDGVEGGFQAGISAEEVSGVKGQWFLSG